MKRTKQVIVARGLKVGVPAAFPHKLVDESGALVPDRFEVVGVGTVGDQQAALGPSAGYDIAASATAVVITRLTAAVAPDIDLLCSRSGLFGPGDFLGAISTPSASAQTTGVLVIPPRDILIVQCRVLSYAQAGIVGLRFNGDAGANYCTRYLSCDAGDVVLANNEEAGANLLRVAGIDSLLGRSVQIAINNLATKEKLCSVQVLSGTGSAAVPPAIEWGGGTWVNTAAQITSIEMVEDDGHFFVAGFAVWGRNLA